MKKFIACIQLAILIAPAAVCAQESVNRVALTSASEPKVLETVVVTGSQPAPGLWELKKQGKTLLIMGTLTPVPKQMSWNSTNVEKRIAESGAILEPPSIKVGTDVGILRGALLWPSYRRTKLNPDDKRLSDILSPNDYLRWKEVRNVYLGSDEDVDRLRPVYAAKKLFDAAVRKSGMTEESIVDPVVRKVAKKNGIPVFSTSLSINIKNPKETINRLNSMKLNDTECLVRTINRLQFDLSETIERTNAWATGDVAEFRRHPYEDQKNACIEAFASNEIAREQGILNLSDQIQEKWLSVARQTLGEHDVVFATFPIDRLIAQRGVLDVLQDEGFEIVESPE